MVTFPNANLVNTPIENYGLRRWRRYQPVLHLDLDSNPDSVEKLSALVGLSAKKLKQSISEDKIANKRKSSISYAPRRKNLNTKKDSPSVIKKSISLILNYPDAVKEISNIEFVNYEKPGIKILIKLLKNITDEPNMNTAALIERWREDDEGKYLSKLAINSFPKNQEFNAEEELNNCLAKITKNFYNERILLR